LKELMDKLEQNEVKVKQTTDFPLEKAKDAHTALQTASANGKTVLLI
jgi:NADPH:quinone reductase-like Zn-dependent oxidoreductase